jgi:hypothetical protein
MALTAAQIAQLTSELTTDPTALGYAGMSNAEVVAAINRVRGTIAIEPRTLVAQRVVEALELAEYDALTAGKRDKLGLLLEHDEVEITAATKAIFTDVFGAGTATRADVAALLSRDGSRAEQLFGVDTVVGLDDVRKARA